MSDLKKSFTSISEVARQRLGITRDEYALCSYVHYRCADSRQKIAGWCCDAKEEVADFVGITRPGLYKMIERLEELCLLETGILGAIRATPKWIDTENECKQSLQDGVNKVDTRCKQSLHGTVNKVDTHNKVEYDISENKLEVEEEKPASRFSSSSENENQTLNPEKKETPPPSSAPPPPKKDYGNLCPDCHGAGWHLGRNGRETCETCLGNGLNSERLLHPPFTPVGTIEPQPATIVRLYDNELPGATIVDSAPGTYETKRGKSQRRNTPHIHPENETCFSYFSDPAKARAAWKDWIDYKYEQHRERYKAAKSELSKLRQLFKQFSGDSEKFEAAVNHSIGNLYKGVFPPKQEKENGQFQHLDKAQQQHLKYARFVADLRNGSAFADAGKVDYVTGEKPV